MSRQSTFSPFRPAAVRAPSLLLLAFALGGCVSPVAQPDVAGAASQASSTDGAIVLDPAGGPVDVAGGEGRLLTLPRAVWLSLRHDPDVQAALARVRAAEAEAGQGRLLPNPVLSVAFRFPENSGKPIIDAGLTAEFVSLLTRPGRVEAADDRLRAAAAEAVTAVLDTLVEVRERYAAVQSLDALMPVLDERRNLIAKLQRLAQDRLNAGEGTRLDATTLETQQIELEVETAERRLERRQERLALARLIGRPTGAIEWEVSPWDATARAVSPESEWVRAALDHRPEIEAGRWELAALGVERRLTRFAPFDGADAGVTSERDPDWSVGPTLTAPLPIFDWGQARSARAEALRLEAEHKLTKARRRAVEEVRKAYAEFEANHATLELVRTRLLPAQQQRRAQTEAAYQTGQTDVTTLVLADQDLQAARTKLIDLQRKTASAVVRLERSVGGPGVAGPLSSAAPPATAPTSTPSTRSGHSSFQPEQPSK